MNLKNLNLKFLIQAHTKLGLFAFFFFYISAVFGTVTLFLPQIKTWESPSRYFVYDKEYNYKLDELIKRTIIQEKFSTDEVEVTLPSYSDNVIAVNDPASRTKYINPYTSKMLDTTSDKAFLSDFFNQLHIGIDIPNIGVFLMGIASVLILFLLFSGLILFFNKHKKKNKAKKDFNYKWHKNLSIAIAPFILVFALTGSVIGFMFPTSSSFALTASQGEHSNMRSIVGPILFKKDVIPEKSKETVELMNIDDLLEKAKELYPQLQIQKLKLLQWNNKNAQIKFFGYSKKNRIMSGKINRLNITLDAKTGQEISRKTIENSHISSKTLSSFYFLHFIPDETLLFRLVYLVLCVLFILSLIFGFLIWSEKKASKYIENRNYYNFLERFSISIIFGVFPCIALTLVLYWALPFELFQRTLWIKGLFYTFWAFTLVLSTYYDDLLNLIKSLSLMTSFFLISAVIAHMMNASEYLIILLKSSSMHTVLYFDLVLIILSIMCFIFYKNAHKIKYFVKLTRSVNVN